MGGMNGPMTVKQTADALTIERQGANGATTTTYKLDGGAATAYTVPFAVTGDGTHAVVVTTTDSAGNSNTQTWPSD